MDYSANPIGNSVSSNHVSMKVRDGNVNYLQKNQENKNKNTLAIDLDRANGVRISVIHIQLKDGKKYDSGEYMGKK